MLGRWLTDDESVETCEFEEKQYEIALTFELVNGTTEFFPSGQVLEALVGYDVALSPDDPRIWKLLDAGIPPGALLDPTLWTDFPNRPSADQLPPRLVSLILQVKRAQYLDHWRAGQHDYWKGPYFRFYTDARQQARLERLESRVGTLALVRYVAPAFLTYSDLCRNQLKRELASESSFVGPSGLTGHRLWSYAGPGIVGYANPEGHEVEADTFETLLTLAADQAQEQSLSDHVRGLALEAGLDEMERVEEWTQILRRDLSENQRSRINDWAVFSDAVASVGATWLVLGFE
jgi:hypothetical protein